MKLSVRLLQWKDLTPGRLAAWADLESRALDPNAYLSPYFVVKDMRRCMRRLKDIGPVTWPLLQGTAVDEACTDRFLELERADWKGDQGEALLSDSRDEQFFREMVSGFAGAGRALFAELRVGDRVISSTSNFLSGQAAFAFKIGWHRDFAKMSPGILNEVELIRQALSLLGKLEFFDSGSGLSSYIDELWVDRRPLSKSLFVTSARATSCTALLPSPNG